MHLARVEVRNFRCLKEVTVDLAPGLNVFVGRNNVGKTSLLSAIRIALGSAASSGESLWLTEDDFYRASKSDAHEREISIVLEYRGLSPDERANFYEIIDWNESALDEAPAVIRFTATWDSSRNRVLVRRSGGASGPVGADVPPELLSFLPITFLPALRDAEASLVPGPRSRLAVMLRNLAERRGAASKQVIEQIFADANAALESEDLIQTARASLRQTTSRLAGSDYAEPAIRAASQSFDRILRSLQIQVPGAPIDSLYSNGLGYNNLLYTAVVLEHVSEPVKGEAPLLMVEEPEAHLHPQLVLLLAEFLSSGWPGRQMPQVLVSTHSPTLVSVVPPERIYVLFQPASASSVRCNSLGTAQLSQRENAALRRMMDVTRASMFFAKGLILVEGVCEALLLPVLAKRLGVDLAEAHVAVIPICGVAFETFRKILAPTAFGIPTAIVTDGDPPLDDSAGESWRDLVPEEVNGRFTICDRTTALSATFLESEIVQVFHSQVTLEYDLAEAGDQNAAVIARAWENCFEGTPRTLNAKMVEAAGLTARQKALLVWRGVCLANSTGSKAALSQRLAEMLSDEGSAAEFRVPAYIESAIRHVTGAARMPEVCAETAHREAHHADSVS